MNKTFKELGFKAGYRVRCVSGSHPFTPGEVYRLENGNLGPCVRIGGANLNGYGDTWERVTPAFDPSTNRVPFGLLEEWEQEALMQAAEVPGAVVDFYTFRGRWESCVPSPRWGARDTYRVTLPTRVSVSDLTGSVVMKDGKPDWSTYDE